MKNYNRIVDYIIPSSQKKIQLSILLTLPRKSWQKINLATKASVI